MTTVPASVDWQRCDAARRAQLLRRPAQESSEQTLASVREIVAAVRRDGDSALRRFTEQFDRVRLNSLEVAAEEFEEAEASLDDATRGALDTAMANVRRFHEAQRMQPLSLETQPGVRCERITVAVRAVGLYVPAGSAPLPSTAIMLAVPADVAGCPIRVMATPPNAQGKADPAVLYVARRCGVQRVFKVGGAQAIAAMAYGTETIPRVDKIFGPGNAWVTAAKQLVANDPDGAALDLPAGPSEVLVVADDSARADFVASDLLAQAEHSTDAQAVLVSPSASLIEAVRRELEVQLQSLSREATARQSIATSRFLLVADLKTALEVSNRYAPEHLILEVRNPREYLSQVEAAGSVFLGAWSPEPMGDYCSGTNHVLPTYGHARAFSGLSLLDFTRRITVQELTPEGLLALGPVASRLARLEGLDAHARAVDLRLDALSQSARQ